VTVSIDVTRGGNSTALVDILAHFAVPTESHPTGTKIRSFIVVTVSIDVTWGRNSTALVDILAHFAVPTESHPTGTKIRSFIVLTVSIDVTRGRNSTALVNIFASFAVTIVTNPASTAIISASVLTDGIDITNGGRSSALVNVFCFHIAVSKYRNAGLNRREPVFTTDRLSFTCLNLFTGLCWQLRNGAERNSFHAPSVIKSIRIRNEVLRPGFLSSIIEFTLANRYDKVKALASLVTSAGGYALWTKFCHHRLVGVSV